jgi:hypothetical protein
MLTIETTRYSAVIKAFIERYPAAVVSINKKIETRPAELWCTNATLKSAIDFSLVDGEKELLGFHDGPDNMWVSDDVLPFLKELSEKKILRFKDLPVRNLTFKEYALPWIYFVAGIGIFLSAMIFLSMRLAHYP